MTPCNCIHNDPLLEDLRRQHRLDPQQIRIFRNALFKKYADDQYVRSLLPFGGDLQLHPLQLVQRHQSEIDGATKLLFKNAADLRLETVILRIGRPRDQQAASGLPAAGPDADRSTGWSGNTSKRVTVCVSSQVGCAAACRFCATGQMAMARNLSAAEILDQVLQAGQLLQQEGRRLNNVVFMGMGEPFHNEDNVSEAIARLLSPLHFDRSPRQLLVSTVGIPDAMHRFALRFPAVNLALSLHSVQPDVRRQLIPLAAKHSLDELHDAVREVTEVRQRHVMMEYLMLNGVNDSPADARDLISWLRGLRCKVNLIPFNQVPHAPELASSPPERIQSFARTLRDAGLETTVRYSLGKDVAAACGQLVRQQKPPRPGKTRHSSL